MGFFEDLVGELGQQRSDQPKGWGAAIGRTLENLSGLDPAYADRRRREALMPLEAQRLKLGNLSMASTLDDAVRERQGRAAAPGAARNVLDAYRPTDAVAPALSRPVDPDEDEEAAAFIPRTPGTPGRPAARTLSELLARMKNPDDYETAAKYRPEVVRGLGLKTPEEVEKSDFEAGQRKKIDALFAEAEGLDLSAPDYRDRAYSVAARIAMAERKPGDYMKAITRSEDPVETIKRLRGAVGGDGDMADRLTTSTDDSGKVRVGLGPKPQPSIDKNIIAESVRLYPNDTAAQIKYQVERKAEATGAVKRDDQPKEILSPEEAGQLGVPYGTTKGGAAGKGSVPLTAAQRSKVDAQAGALAIVEKMERDLASAAKPSGPLARVFAAPRAMWDVYAQADPELAELHSRINGTLAPIVRAFGEVGALTDQDQARARALMPVLAPIPDTADVVKRKIAGLKSLLGEIAARTGQRPGESAPPKRDDKGKGGDTLSRKSAAYRKAKDSGMSDTDIAAAAGATLVD